MINENHVSNKLFNVYKQLEAYLAKTQTEPFGWGEEMTVFVCACSNAASRSKPNETATVKFDCFALSSKKEFYQLSKYNFLRQLQRNIHNQSERAGGEGGQNPQSQGTRWSTVVPRQKRKIKRYFGFKMAFYYFIAESYSKTIKLYIKYL